MALALTSLDLKLQVIDLIDLDDLQTDYLSQTCKHFRGLFALCTNGIERKIGARPSVSAC